MGRANGQKQPAVAALRRGRAAERAEALELPELDGVEADRLIALARAGNLRDVCEGLYERGFRSDAGLSERSRVLDAMADAFTPSYRERWDRQVGAFVAQLRVFPPAGPEPGAEEQLGEAVWPEGYAAVARRLARLNLEDSAQAGHVLSNGFAAELVSVAWRNTFLSQLRRRGEAEGAQMLTHATARHGELTETLLGLQQQAGGAQKLAGHLTWELWYALWQQHRRALRARGFQVLPELLLTELGRAVSSKPAA